MKIVVVGGGAAGFFAALAAKESNADAEVIILERTAKLLSKVRVSGGGRCNVTHACFEPRELIKNYPRGSVELLGPFSRFQPRDTVEWFESRGVELKEEKDGRMFPITDSSETIIDCLVQEAERLGVVIKTLSKLEGVDKRGEGFEVKLAKEVIFADRLILATGSAKAGWELARELGHTIIDPVPSLFTFNIPDFALVELAGVSLPEARLKIKGSKFEQEGPLLITHWGFSGPCALKLSAFAARHLAEREYQVMLSLDWLPRLTDDEVRVFFEERRAGQGAKMLKNLKFDVLPSSLWKALLVRAGVDESFQYKELGNKAISKLVETLKRDHYTVSGKTTNKEEFVTCGGVELSEVNFKTMESKCCKHLYFCGEVLDIDGVTGGFNFQNSWTTGRLAGQASAS